MRSDNVLVKYANKMRENFGVESPKELSFVEEVET